MRSNSTSRVPSFKEWRARINRGHYRIFYTFIDEVLDSRSQGSLSEAMSRASQALGLNAFSYLNIVPRSKVEPQLISTYPKAWTSRYLRERFEKYDPVIIRAKHCSAPFEWGIDALTTTTPRKGREIFEEAAQHGIRRGISIPIPTDGRLFAAVSFTTEERKSCFQACIGPGAVLQFMAVLFHRQIRSLAARERQIGDIILSLREFECLDWASRGKSAWEIGCILEISRATVAFHLENAKRKLGVKSITQAVARFASSR